MWMWISVGVSVVGLLAWMRQWRLCKEYELRLALAGEQLERLPRLEEALREKEKELTQSAWEFKGIEEKLKTLLQAEEQLKTVFRALSSEALERNNRSFVDLAKVTLEKYQEGAKGDLEKRQQAIGELLKPMSEALQKLDQGIGHIEKERKADQQSLKEQVKSLLGDGKATETRNIKPRQSSPHSASAGQVGRGAAAQGRRVGRNAQPLRFF